jgi:hypothetical protein
MHFFINLSFLVYFPLRYREILVQISIFLAKPISKLLWASQKNSKDDQKILYIKEIN